MSARGRIRAAARFLGRVLSKSRQDELGLRTSALAFSTLIALVPLLAGVSILLARTLRSNDRRVLELLVALLPYREESIVAALESFLEQAASLSGIAILGFLLTSVLTFFAVQETLFRIFRVGRPPSFGRRLVTFSMLFFWGPLLVGFTQAGYLLLRGARPELAQQLDRWLFGMLPFAMTFLGLTMLYWRAALGRVRFRDAAVGGFAATLAIELLGELFQVYVAQFTEVQRAVYGTFAILLFFVLSIQLAWWILLFGAEIAAVLADERRGRPLAPPAPEPDPWIGLGALELLAAPGRPTLAPHELAPRLGLDAQATICHLHPLVEAGVLESGESYRLALPPQEVRIASVLAAYRRRLSSGPASPLPENAAALRIRLHHALEHEVGDQTLTDLLAEQRPSMSSRGVLARPDAPG